MRLLGVLVGSALAVGALVVFIGIPEFTQDLGGVFAELWRRYADAGAASPSISFRSRNSKISRLSVFRPTGVMARKGCQWL